MGQLGQAGHFTAFCLALVLLSGTALAQGGTDADEFCRQAGRNQAIFEMVLLPGGASVRPGPAPGAFSCVWVFKRGDDEIYTMTLESELLASELAARQTILMARLPENHRVTQIEPLVNVGDDGLTRATVVNGVTTLLELEAVKGRRHFLLTIRPRPGKGVNHRVTAASSSFLGGGISSL